MKKLFKFIVLFVVFMLLLADYSFASVTSSTRFEVVDKSVCEMVFGQNGSFTKQIVSYDENSVTLQLDVKNTAEQKIEKTNSEIFFVIDNSLSLKDTVSEEGTRKDVIYNAAKELATKLYTKDSDFKIGVISFSSCSDSSKEGTIDDATLIQSLTLDSSKVLDAIEDINNTDFGSRTNIEAGLELASRNFSGTADKEFIILLSDGVPDNDIHGNTIQYSDIVMENTKNKLIELNARGINIISVLSGVSTSIEPTVGLSYVELAEKVFGTETFPTAGKYYLVSDSDSKTIIENNVFNDIEISSSNTLTNIVIRDYFPQEIIDNFDFSYVLSPVLGSVSAEVDRTTNSITWTIPSLEAGQVATLQYVLTLKDNYSTSILDKILPTNEKVNITDDEGDNETSTVSPKVKVTIENTPAVTPPSDNSVIPNPVLPKTGVSNIALFIIAILGVLGVLQYIRYKNII